MSNFGEMSYESSRAMADDEDEEYPSDNPKYQNGLIIEWTDEGEKYLKEASNGSHTFCAFVGKVGLGFGEGFIKKKDSTEFSLLGQIFVIGNEGTVDLYAQRPRRTPKVRIYLGGKGSANPVIFALIDFYGVPRVLSNEVAYKMSNLLRMCSEAIVFHSEVSAYYRGDGENLEGKLLFLNNQFFSDKNKPKQAAFLPPPNLISGPSAAIISYCQMIKKPAFMLITYSETEMVDSISMRPFFLAIEQKSKGSTSSTDIFDFGKVFSNFQHKIQSAANSTYNSPVVNSNLYV